jgi:hypothetical protein
VESQIRYRYPVGYRIAKKARLSCQISVASLVNSILWANIGRYYIFVVVFVLFRNPVFLYCAGCNRLLGVSGVKQPPHHLPTATFRVIKPPKKSEIKVNFI